jgi:hypothetical protein
MTLIKGLKIKLVTLDKLETHNQHDLSALRDLYN